MSYYPNYYTGFPYGMQVSPQGQLQQPFQQPQINGKIVDSVDIVRVTEVPVGGYGVFPRADMGEVYIKTWGQDGTTQIVTYKPAPPEQPAPPAPDINDQLLERLNALEGKIDSIIMAAMMNKQPIKEEKQDEHNANTSTVTTKF